MRKTTACPINQILDIISAKWTTEIIRELSIGPTRTRRFLAAIPGLTMKALRQRLLELERYEFIHREQLSERPPKVQYTITDKGRKLAGLLAHIKAFADDLNGGAACSCPMREEASVDQLAVECPERRESRLPHQPILHVVQQ